MVYCPICEPELTGVFIPLVCCDCRVQMEVAAKNTLSIDNPPFDAPELD